MFYSEIFFYCYCITMSESLGMAISSQIDVSQYKGLSHFTRRQVSVAPSNLSVYTSSASTGDCYFDLPAGSRSMINGEASYLTFDLDINLVIGTTNAQLANGNASSLISVLQTVIQNAEVETLQNYNVYANMLYDLQGIDRQTGICSILNGADTASQKTGANLVSAPLAAGYGPKIRVTIPIHSAILGVGQSNFCPALDGIRMRFGFSPTDVALKCTAAAAVNYRLSNIALKMEYLDMTDTVYRQLLDESGGIFKVSGTAVANFQTATANASVQSLLIPARYSSVKSMLCSFRLSSDINSYTKNSVGARVNPYVKNYRFSVDGRNMNPVPVIVDGGAGEVLSEVQNVFNAVSSNQFAIAGTSATYLTSASTDTGCFILGMNYEELSMASGQQITAGIDTNSSNTFLNMENTQVVANGITVDTFAHYDVILSADMINGSVSISK